MPKIKLNNNFIKNVCRVALNEDLYPSGDITSNLLGNNTKKKAELLSNQAGIIGGLEFVKQTFKLIDKKIKIKIKKNEGSQIKKGDLIATIENFSRKDVDGFALESQNKAAKARESGKFKSIVPVRDQNGLLILEHDEHIRVGATLNDLENLKPSFETIGQMGMDSVALQNYPHIESIHHVHTPGNSSGIVLSLIHI